MINEEDSLIGNVDGAKHCNRPQIIWPEIYPPNPDSGPGYRDAIIETANLVTASTTVKSTAVTKRHLNTGAAPGPTAAVTLPNSDLKFHDRGRSSFPENDELGKSPEMSSNASHRYDTS